MDRFGLLWWLVDPHFFGLMPAAGASAPPSWIGPMGLLVDIGSLLTDCGGGSAVALMGRDEFDAAVAVPVVVPIHKSRHPLAGFVFSGEYPFRGRDCSSRSSALLNP